jgi:hypothetical protein
MPSTRIRKIRTRINGLNLNLGFIAGAFLQNLADENALLSLDVDASILRLQSERDGLFSNNNRSAEVLAP